MTLALRGDAPDASLFTIEPGHEALLGRMLAVNPRNMGGWRLHSVSVADRGVRALYRHPSQAVLTLVLLHPSADAGAIFRTERFAVKLDGPTPPGVAGLLERVRATIARLERDFVWTERRTNSGESPPGSPSADLMTDVELLAFRRGLKPAVRRTCRIGNTDGAADRFRAAGASIARLEQPAELGGASWEIVYFAHSQAEADELRDLERRVLAHAQLEENRTLNRELGQRLGYPACCVEVFCIRLEQPGWARREVSSATYVAAVDAWVRLPLSRLNNLRVGEGLSLVSFEPCRYDCAAAGLVADAAAAALAEAHPASLAVIDSALARNVAVAPSGARAVVRLDAVSIAEATALRRTSLEPAPSADEAWARSLLGARIDAAGLVSSPGSGEPRSIVLRFERTSG